MQAAGIDTKVYGPHSIHSASSKKAAEVGNEIDKVKKHANWSLFANTSEQFYYKSPHQYADSKKITDSICSTHVTIQCLNITSRSTGTGLGTSSNTIVDERGAEDVVTQSRWYERFFYVSLTCPPFIPKKKEKIECLAWKRVKRDRLHFFCLFYIFSNKKARLEEFIPHPLSSFCQL
ncbi:hypothetical protein BCV72DRAFT_327951 [Rhizopus microsporus var. microsporus]|uniref:Uncharacterized protein n=1 Tax=Rhizopus microsporus var. microsporus TaxID=86635 RepID=A0A1X0R4E0_RHIZD|nr:hypothetical protein BCV72DRAFT_327951 [Rhizopus microsporus var. microsporus]